MSCWEAVGNEGILIKKKDRMEINGVLGIYNFLLFRIFLLWNNFFFSSCLKEGDRGISRKVFPRLLFLFILSFS